MRGNIVILGILCLCLVNLVDMAAATVADNGEPEVRAWFTWMQEDGTWHEWVESTEENKDILYNVELKIGQPIKCKIEITPKYDGRVDFYIRSLRTASPYSVVEGRKMEEIVSFEDISANQTVTYTYILKPNGNWIGHAPINCYWEVNYEPILNLKEDTGLFAFANPIILAEEWEGPSLEEGQEPEKETGSVEGSESMEGETGGFSLPIYVWVLIVLIVIIIMVLVLRVLK